MTSSIIIFVMENCRVCLVSKKLRLKIETLKGRIREYGILLVHFILLCFENK